MFAVLADARPAAAFELFGICFTGNCAENADGFDIVDPRNYEVTFNVTGNDTGEVEDDLKAASNLWGGRDRPVAGSAGLTTRAKGDYQRILAALYNAGRYDGAISITVEGREAADLPPGADIGNDVQVRVDVDAGHVYRFGRADIINQAPFDVTPEDFVPLPTQEGFAPGDPALAGKVRLAGALSVRAWRQLGHPKAKVVERDANAIHPERQLDVTIRMDPGPKAAFGQVYVEGAERMDPAFIAYMTGIPEGQEYDPDVLKRARERLDRLGVFAVSKFEEAEFVTNDGLLPINLLVQERKLRRIGVGVTLSTIDGAGVEAFWLHRNLFGQAEQLRLDAKVGGIGNENSLSPDDFDYFVGASFKKPGVYDPDIDLLASIFAKREFNETFRETSTGGSLGFAYYYSREITATLAAFAKYGEYEDAFGTRSFTTAGLDGDLLYDGRDSKVEPTKGIYADLKVKPFHEFEFGNSAVRLEAEGRSYLAFDDEGRTVLAGRVKVGSLFGAPIAETPPDLLFTTGGGGSVRGYGFRNIGVRNAAGDVTGGRSLVEGSIELRQRFGDTFGAVVFADAGTVGTGTTSFFDDDLKIGVGAGIRYYTGLGAIRLDVAVPLDPDPDDPSFGIYAGIGQAF